MKSVIDVEAVSFAYGPVPVLSGINLRIEAGEFLGIVGPNAGGKSTLLKLILGLLNPQSGNIRVLGQPTRVASRLLGYVPQYPAFPRDFPITVEQVVLLGRLGVRRSNGLFGGLWPTGLSQEDREAAHQALAEVEVEHVARSRIDHLSGGQLQRVLIARALVGEPRILILDEPTANIDQRMENEIFDLLKMLNERMTILVVSHDIAFISQYVSRVACVNQTLMCHQTGAIHSDTIHDLYGKPVHMITHKH